MNLPWRVVLAVVRWTPGHSPRRHSALYGPLRRGARENACPPGVLAPENSGVRVGSASGVGRAGSVTTVNHELMAAGLHGGPKINSLQVCGSVAEWLQLSNAVPHTVYPPGLHAEARSGPGRRLLRGAGATSRAVFWLAPLLSIGAFWVDYLVDGGNSQPVFATQSGVRSSCASGVVRKFREAKISCTTECSLPALLQRTSGFRVKQEVSFQPARLFQSGTQVIPMAGLERVLYEKIIRCLNKRQIGAH